MWTENESCDLALSFQEKAGCDDIWEKICQVIMAYDKSWNRNSRILKSGFIVVVLAGSRSRCTV